MRRHSDQRGPLILRESDIETLGPAKAARFWTLARLRSLDS